MSQTIISISRCCSF